MDKKTDTIEEHSVDFQWIPNSRIPDPAGSADYVDTGTLLKINNYIMFLKSLSDRDLQLFKHTVNLAVDHEISTRK